MTRLWTESGASVLFLIRSPCYYLSVNDHNGMSFFWPLYGSYIIFDLDQTHYQHALVCGPDTSYFWILAREPKMDDVTRADQLSKAVAMGFATNALIYPQQD